MRILKFYSENFKRIKVVEFDPNGNFVVISGKNGQGKSSVLDAIWATFQHKATKGKMSSPVRHGEDKATNIIEIDDYVVTRTYDSDGDSKLRIETKDGNIVKSPQALLDRLVGSLSFDPLQFSNARDADRREMLEEIFGLNLAEFDAKDAALKEQRRDKKRELEMIEGRLGAILPPTHADPASEASATELISELAGLNSARNRFEQMAAEYDSVIRQILELEKKRDNLFAEIDAFSVNTGYVQETYGVRAGQLAVDIRNIEQRNARAREVIAYYDYRKKADAVAEELQKIKDRLELNAIERDEKIEGANIPVDGLEITEKGILLNDLPFDQLSQAEKIRASMAIAMAANPELRVMRIIDGSLLDSASMQMVEELAKTNDYQVWIEVVSESDKIGVVIEDGEIKAIN
jgi:DNA repair exonuclease SbcCD ATPase subunit